MALMSRSTAVSSKAAASRPLRAGRVARASVRVNARAGNWLPGTDAPTWLPDGQAGNFGFDPLGLAKNDISLKRFTEAELIHSRWAMMGAAGIMGVELLGFGNWYDAPVEALNGGHSTYLGAPVPFDLATLTAIEFLALAVVESKRNAQTDFDKRCYPGGAFDPLGLGSKDAKAFESNKLKELKNGRVAMVAMLGFVAQHAATGKSPLTNLKDHIASPWTVNFATNGVSIPQL